MTRGRRPTGRYVTHQYNHSADASPQARRARAAIGRDNREPSTKRGAIAAFDCWCGGIFGHDWEGKADGKPHPR